MKEIDLVSKVRIYDYEELTESDRELVELAKKATQTSYAPYSGFCVGAAARLSDGTIVTGSNQENAAFPSGTCAERTALFYANARHPGQSVEELAVAAYTRGNFLKVPIPPCGACRQVMQETFMRQGTDYDVIMLGASESLVVKASSLLPFAFELG